MNNTLVACFSPTGNTWGVAGQIASYVPSELFRITPVIPYTPADLDWNDAASRSSLEMKDPASRPEISEKVRDMNNFQIIFLGFPIWWYDAPHIILTFLASYNFAAKVMFPFVTSGSSGLGKIPQTLRNACPDANWQAGMRFSPHPDARQVEDWVMECHGWKQ